MKQFFKSARINPILRFLNKGWLRIKSASGIQSDRRVRVSGNVNITIADTTFQMFAQWDDGIVDMLFFNAKAYTEYNDLVLFGELACKSRTVIDIGAHTGLFAIYSQAKNPTAQVYAFEPYPANARRLKRNVALNGMKNINLHEVALGKSSGRLEFAVPEKEQICDVLSADIQFTNRFYRQWIQYTTIYVPQNTLDGFVRQEGLHHVDLIKIDVENFELAVLEGSMETLRKHGPLILLESFVDDERIQFFEQNLKPLGYYCYLISKSGLERIPGLVNNLEGRNFLLSRKKSERLQIPFSAIQQLVDEIS